VLLVLVSAATAPGRPFSIQQLAACYKRYVYRSWRLSNPSLSYHQCTTMVSIFHPNGDDDVLVDILQGRERIVSYPATSQFNSGRGVSACGLAAMNFASVLFDLIHTHGEERLVGVLRAIISRETIEVSVSGGGNELSCFSAHHLLSSLTKHYTTGHHLHLLGMVK
jgi:hypothetical protein